MIYLRQTVFTTSKRDVEATKRDVGEHLECYRGEAKS